MTHVFPVTAEEWRLHPSFDRTPLRIIDTPENTYFLVHQQIYNKTLIGYDFPSLTLFQYDKNASDKGITPLVHDVSLSSADLRMADYSPKGEYLFVAYNDGGIDLIDKGKHLTHIDRLKRYTIPGMAKITSVSFDPSTGDAWVGTDAGYMHIDAGDFTIKDVKVFDRGIDRICRFGDKLVAVSGNAAWQSEAINPFTFNEFKQISSVDSPSTMLPLADNEFAFVSGAPGTTRTLKLARLEGGSWKVSNLGSDNFYSVAPNETLVNRYEANFIPNKDGYLIFSTSKAWQLYAPKNGEATKFVSISLDANPVSLGSWDFSDFWAYRDRGTFVPCHAEYTPTNATATAIWADTQSPIRPDAPAAFICTYMDYSPKYGLLVVNHGQEWHFRNDSPQNPPLLSGFKNGWNVYSYAYNTPYAVDNDENLRSIYITNINRFPLPDPNGLLVDPFNPDWVCFGSMFGGFMYQNLSDLKSDPVKFAAENDLFVTFPGIVPAVPKKTWGTLSSFSSPTIDSNGTIWTMYSNTWSEPQCQFMFFTKEDREKIFNSDKNSLKDENCWHMIDVDFDEFIHWASKLKALKNGKNVNKLVMCRGESTSPIVIFDHNGTPMDITDDKIKKISKVRIKKGNLLEFVQVYDVIEDPNTGEILVLTSGGAIVFDISESTINDEIINGSVLCLNDGDKNAHNPQINKICFDDKGIYWLATDDQGLLGVSKDDKIVFSYNTSNSDIPSNKVFGVAWNKLTGSVMVSTDKGIAEVFPDQMDVAYNQDKVGLNMYYVIPGYNGDIEIRNVAFGSIITIYDDNGNDIKRFSNVTEKIVKWDLKNEQGLRVGSGVYQINVDNQKTLELVVMSEDK